MKPEQVLWSCLNSYCIPYTYIRMTHYESFNHILSTCKASTSLFRFLIAQTAQCDILQNFSRVAWGEAAFHATQFLDTSHHRQDSFVTIFLHRSNNSHMRHNYAPPFSQIFYILALFNFFSRNEPGWNLFLRSDPFESGWCDSWRSHTMCTDVTHGACV
jgi:hypothetical protein